MSYKEVISAKNVFYFPYINSIGGVETFFYNLARKYKNNDILILYNAGDQAQLNRLRRYVRVVQYKGQDVICEKVFFNYSIAIIDSVKADEYLQIIHADYEAQGMKPAMHKKITRYLCASEVAKESFERLTGIEGEVVYNPLAFMKPRRVLRLISATRLTKEKGKERIRKMISELHKADIPFEWTIYTNDKTKIEDPSVIYKGPVLDICNYIAGADYLVQLSDTEAYCYSVVEALTLGVPVIVTPCSVFKEIGFENGVNGFEVPFDMTNLPLDDIYKSKLKFEYKPIKDSWRDILAPGESQYQKDLKTEAVVKATRSFFDIEKLESVPKDAIILTNKVRAEQLINANVAELVEGD